VQVNLQTSLILYQVASPTARRDYLAKYGCSKWSEEVGAHDTVRRHPRALPHALCAHLLCMHGSSGERHAWARVLPGKMRALLIS